MTNTYIVSLFIVDRNYGGPEEGGWWYDCGDPVDIEEATDMGYPPKMFTDRDEALLYLRSGYEKIEGVLNEGRPAISSVLSEGRYQLHLSENKWPAAYPAERPYYE